MRGFTLDQELGEFVLTHDDITIPTKGKIYSVNEGNSAKWNEATNAYVQALKKIPYSLRYIGTHHLPFSPSPCPPPAAQHAQPRLTLREFRINGSRRAPHAVVRRHLLVSG